MTHMNSNLSDSMDDQSSGEQAPGSADGSASKPADTVYRIAALVGALILLVTVVWAG
jgi:hypothetical protein